MKTPAQTDPEFVTAFEDFINLDVKPHGNLPSKTRWLVIMAAHIATQSPNEYKVILRESLKEGVSPTEAKEVI